MKHVRESLKSFNTYQFFKLFEEEKPETDKQSLKDKEKDGLAIIDKITSNFEDFKKDAKGEILKYKEFWEENQSSKKGFTETGSVYKMYDDDYVVGVLELPAEVLSDGSIEGGLGATDEPEEEIIEGKEITQDEPSMADAQPVTEAEEGDDLDLDLNLDDDPAGEPMEEPASELPAAATEQPAEDPAAGEPTEQQPTEEPVEDPAGEPMETTPEEPSTDMTAPQTYFVVYDMSGGEREEIFRCGSNNIVKAFNAFYNDTFKGSMKDIILQYKQQKEEEKKEAEKSEKTKAEKEKQSKVQKFLGKTKTNESLYEDIDLGASDMSDDQFEESGSVSWYEEIREYLVNEYQMTEEDADLFMEIADEQLQSLQDGGSSSYDAASIIANDEDIWDELKSQTSEEEEFPQDETGEELEDEELEDQSTGLDDDEEDKFEVLRDDDTDLSDDEEDEVLGGEEDLLDDEESEISTEDEIEDYPEESFEEPMYDNPTMPADADDNEDDLIQKYNNEKLPLRSFKDIE